MRKMEGKMGSEELWQQWTAPSLFSPPLSLLHFRLFPLSSLLLHPSLPASLALLHGAAVYERGLLGLASLQCREGKGGSFTTMRWRMVHQEKRVYQVCDCAFACFRCPGGNVSLCVASFVQAFLTGIHQAALMCGGVCVCPDAIFSC